MPRRLLPILSRVQLILAQSATNGKPTIVTGLQKTQIREGLALRRLAAKGKFSSL